MGQAQARLLAGLARLGMELTGAELDKSVRQALSGAPTEAGILKLIVSRRAAGRGYQAADNPHTSTTVIFSPPLVRCGARPDAYRVRLCQTPASINRATAGLKHLCRLENVLARSEWSCPDIHEGLLQDPTGHIIEATAHNLFIVRGGALLTPDLSEAGVSRGYAAVDSGRFCPFTGPVCAGEAAELGGYMCGGGSIFV